VAEVWRNKEIRVFLISMALLGAAATGAAFYISPKAAVFVFFLSIAFIVCNLVFTAYRYREIAKLSGYVRRIHSGDYSLDLRDNKEGELSILKNDIYKVTLKLSEQSSLLQQDKTRLANAMADISHQLKTPLTSLLVMTDLLKEPKLNSRKRNEFILNIETQLKRIEWLVSSLLKISKIDAGVIQLKNDLIPVKRLIDKALEPVLIPMDIKEIAFMSQGEDEVCFLGDLNWTAEAVTNILKNCVEHTPPGGRITIEFAENPLFTEINIADTGCGISKQDIPNIFKRFYKGKNPPENSVGIGLNLAHSIITAQNGDIEVRSVIGEGTQFTIKFYKHTV
jgi:signal transduction histidine kinase